MSMFITIRSLAYFCNTDRCSMLKLFHFRQTFIFVLICSLTFAVDAQVVDGLLGQRRDVTQVLLRPLRIVDYKKERTVFSVEEGIHQTVFYENDSCNRFYWAVTPDKIEHFMKLLSRSGYGSLKDGMMLKDSLELTIRSLESGKATLFIANISKQLEGQRDASGKRVVKPPVSNLEALPLLQQAILAEDQDTMPKPPKDPQRHWVGNKQGEATILGWDGEP